MELPTAYHFFKAQVVDSMGEGHSLVRVHIGLAVYLLFQIGTSTRRGSLSALAFLANCVAWDELMNWVYSGNWQAGDSLRHMAFTLFWPTLLVLTSRFRRWRWRAVQAPIRRKFPLQLAAVPKPVAAAVAVRKITPRLRVFPGYAPSRSQG